ncbi:MAG: DUF4349 domain-containing protein [Coriobacteriia bacterium]|nr:DUF4349 domain-containing protein [Coriobacteriia bacterium]
MTRTRGTARIRAAIALGVALVLMAGLMAGCGFGGGTATSDEYRGDDGVYGEMPAQAPPEVYAEEEYDAAVGSKGDVANVAEADRMIIRSKTVRLEVESTQDAVAEIRTIARDSGGIITGLQVATDTESPIYRYDENGYATGDGAGLRGWVTVRVPADSFEAFVDDIVGLGTVKYQAEDTEDVTQQHVDLSARLGNLRAEEVRLREFFDAATKVEEMLAIEAELSRVRGEIESLDAQVKFLERQAAMATVTIELVEPRPVVRPTGDTWGFLDAVTSGFRGAADLISFGIAALIATSPLWILGLIAFFVVRAILRRRHARAAARAAGTPGGPSTPAPEDAPGT